MKLCAFFFFLFVTCASDLFTYPAEGSEDITDVGVVESNRSFPGGEITNEETTSEETTSEETTNEETTSEETTSEETTNEETTSEETTNEETTSEETTNEDKQHEQLNNIHRLIREQEETLHRENKETEGGEVKLGGYAERKRKEESKSWNELVKKCEDEKKIILEEFQVAQKNLEKCTENNGKNLSECKEQLKEIQKHLNVCRENEDKCYGRIEDINMQCHENISKKGKEGEELREKILTLEKKIEEAELKLKNYAKSRRNSNKEDKDDKDGKVDKDNNDYLISYSMVKSYFIKIFKIYKTLYIIIFEKTFLSNMLIQICYLKDVIMKYIKLYAIITMERLQLYVKIVYESSSIAKLLDFYEHSLLKQYIMLLKNKTPNFISRAEKLYYKMMHTMRYDIFFKMFESLNNKYRNINLDNFVHKLHKNSKFLMNKINSINPELNGIIPPKLEDQLILLIFFTAVNTIHLYIFFYLLFLFFKLIKKISSCLFMCILISIVFIYRCTIFILTIPIRPFMKKKCNRSRKVYRRHNETVCTNPERTSYQHQEFKKMHKGQNVHHRKG
ncbi:hypothetical protein, conserved [Plasmodium gonderi]|uniref:Variable surface protein n=1 Tax=Plasmodium gonderi TaxID=77519 RepID=A0A1Y1JIN9_PLAGO|nr:hypothetical protein, conserved [Plasmodium gonderi]GAW81498.1 hypothetical protein, conserved [Plasmodium gonderi]